MTPEQLAKIEESHRAGHILYPSEERALLDYCRDLEQSLDWVNDWHHGDLGSLHAPPHLAPILAASRKRIAEGK